MNALRAFGKWLWQQKSRAGISLIATIVFLFILFPLGDLSDLVTGEVSKLTSNKVYLQFQDMKLSLIPETGLALEKFHVEAEGLPAIKSEELIFTPSISSLIFQKPAGSIAAKGFLKGELEASLSPGKKSDNGVDRQHITLKAQNINLADLKELASLPLQINGSIQFEADSQVDLKLQEQPEVELQMKIDKLMIPSFTAQTPIGPWPLPEIKVSSVELKGRLSAGKFIIETGNIGSATDDLSGTIKGNISMSLISQDNKIFPSFGGYQLDIDLTFRRQLHEQLKTALGMLEQYKSPLPDGAQVKMRISGTDMMNPPSMNPLR